MALLFIYALLLISQLDNRLSPTFPHLASWLVGLAGEALLIILRVRIYADNRLDHPGHRHPTVWGSWEVTDVAICALRGVLLVLLVSLYVALIVLPRPVVDDDDAEETASLLNGTGDANGYGAIGQKGEPGQAAWARRTTLPTQSWWEYLRGYTIFFPYLWPSKDRRLQVLMIVCFALVLLQRGINVLVPHQLGKVTDILSGEDGGKREWPDGLLLNDADGCSPRSMESDHALHCLPLPAG